MYKLAFPIGSTTVLGLLAGYMVFMFITRLSGDLHGFDIFVMTLNVIAVIGFFWQILEYVKGRYILEKDALIIKFLGRPS